MFVFKVLEVNQFCPAKSLLSSSRSNVAPLHLFKCPQLANAPHSIGKPRRVSPDHASQAPFYQATNPILFATIGNLRQRRALATQHGDPRRGIPPHPQIRIVSPTRHQLHTSLQSNIPPSDGATTTLERVADSYKPLPSFELDKQRSYKQQYGDMYFLRLTKIKPAVEQVASTAWEGTVIGGEEVKKVERVLDVRQGELCWVAGTVYMDMPLKPNILEDVSKDVRRQFPLLFTDRSSC